MFRLLLALVGAEVRHTVRRAATTALLFAIGLLLVGVSLLAALVGIYLLLAERYDPVTAALVIAAFNLLIGLIFLLSALLRTRRRPSRGRAALGAFTAVPPAVVAPAAPPPAGAAPGSPASPDASSVIAIALGAALLGLILGRRV